MQEPTRLEVPESFMTTVLLISGINKKHDTFTMVGIKWLNKLFPPPFCSPNVCTLFRTLSFLEEIVLSGLPMKPLQHFPTHDRNILTFYYSGKNFKVD